MPSGAGNLAPSGPTVGDLDDSTVLGTSGSGHAMVNELSLSVPCRRAYVRRSKATEKNVSAPAPPILRSSVERTSP